MNSEIISFIIRFLTGPHISEKDVESIGYTSNTDVFDQYKVVIKPSSFFEKGIYGTPESLPALPLKSMEGVPLLFGEDRLEKVGQTLIIHADLIASAYFLLSRYEEMVCPDIRDAHGRFPGKASLPYRGGFIHRPIVDLYGKLFRKWLSDNGIRCTEPFLPGLSKIYLTHDVDEPFFCRSWRSVLRLVKKGMRLSEAIRLKKQSIEKDPFYTFPWIFNENQWVHNKYPDTETILFFKTGGRAIQDKPHYSLNSKDMNHLFRLSDQYQAIRGFHSSYLADRLNNQFDQEAKLFQKIVCDPTKRYHRAHFLTSREPEHMAKVEQAGFTDDFTIGYADHIGFRLGTAQAIPYIDPVEQRISKTLKLHPLTAMDSTLSGSRYMHLHEEEAYQQCMQIVHEIQKVNGELVFLWHNTVFAEETGYHRSLYHQLLRSL